MSEFWDLLDEYLGDDDALTDIRVVTRRLWFYDFTDDPVRVWEGQGKLFTTDGNEWLGSIDQSGKDHHVTPNLQDGRDGSSATYTFTLNIPDLPGQDIRALYDELKENQFKASMRNLTCYLAIFQESEALRPQTPIIFFKELIMMAPKFSEVLEPDDGGGLKRVYKVSVTAKDGNYGRSATPRGTYADAIQKQRAKELGVAVDRGSEFLASMANRTYVIP